MGRPKVDGRPGGKKAKDPNKPKRATSAYFYYLAHCREEAKKQGRSISKIAEFTKEASEKWRNLNGKEKQEFESKAAADKQRYDREMQQYGGGRGKQAKDPNAPKKPLTGYFLFLADFRIRHKGRDIQNKDLLKMAGEEWREMDDSQKMPYEKKSQEEQKKYEVTMAAYRRGGAAANGAGAAVDDEEDDDEEYEDDDE
ncbi:high mobility group protein B3-like [Ruditapes philippinarum]|uniref:high mobility group protein B3-like n=1 Tax=Ruditapes philippinarum TaxID=129788 RepID=UPI00295AB77A|nr:high mobility group protein B3-like [Ruditapes philippinarum]